VESIVGFIESVASSVARIESFKKVLENPLLINNPSNPEISMNLMYNLVGNSYEIKNKNKFSGKLVKQIFKTTYFLHQKQRITKANIRYFVFVAFFLCNWAISIGQKDSTQFMPVKRVVIDAGHGGHDPGCLGEDANEKNICLAVSLHLGKLIENYFPDVEVIYTRKTDVFVKLYERAEIANRNKADLFISIHVNSAENKSAYGTESYVMGTKYTDRNLEIAKRENSVIFMEDDYEENYDQSILGFDPSSPMADIIMQLLQQEYLHQSILFASKVENQFSLREQRRSRGVKQRVLLVMYRTAMPSSLIELGFLSNKEEHELLKSEDGVINSAGAIFRAFLQYKREMEGVAPPVVAKEENDVFLAWKKYSDFLKEDKPFDSSMKSKLEIIEKPLTNEKLKDNIKQLNTDQNNSDLVFKVQITSSSKKIPLNSSKFNGLQEISEYVDHNYFKYTHGNCVDMECALKMQKQAKTAGFNDCFVIAFYKGQRVSIKKAKEILDQK